VLPQGADQFMNAPVLVSSGAGLALLPPEVSADHVAEATSRLLGEPSFAAATSRMQAELAAMPSADVVLAQQLAALPTR
jgi:UDP:flavonoid glycosyltransferase YjiC (YdhE family)